MCQEDIQSSQEPISVKTHHRVFKGRCGTQKWITRLVPKLNLTADYEKNPETIKVLSAKSDDDDTVYNTKTKPAERRKFTEFSETDNANIRTFFDMNCKMCDCQFSTFKDAQDHYREAHGRSGFVHCCDKKFRRPCEIKDHIRKHLQPDSFK